MMNESERATYRALVERYGKEQAETFRQMVESKRYRDSRRKSYERFLQRPPGATQEQQWLYLTYVPPRADAGINYTVVEHVFHLGKFGKAFLQDAGWSCGIDPAYWDHLEATLTPEFWYELRKVMAPEAWEQMKKVWGSRIPE